MPQNYAGKVVWKTDNEQLPLLNVYLPALND